MHPSRTVVSPALLLFALAGCSHRSSATFAPAPARSAPAAAPTETCPIVALQLVHVAPDGARQEMMSLDTRGRLLSPMAERTATPFAVLDAQGCLVSGGETVAEATSDGNVWTETHRFHFVGNELHLPMHRAMRINLDGTVETHDADGGIEPATYGRFAFTNYNARASCAARVMLSVFFAATPSMAASDGHPPRLPAPAGSQCPRSPAAAASPATGVSP